MTVDSWTMPDPGEPTRELHGIMDGPAPAAGSPARREPRTWSPPLPRWVRSVREATSESLIVTTYLLAPVLMRTEPSRSGSSLLPLPHRRTTLLVDDAAPGRLAGPAGSAAAVAVPRRTVPRRLPPLIDRSLARLFRASAWRYARSSRASVVPGRGWTPTGTVGTAEPASPPSHRRSSAAEPRRGSPFRSVSAATGSNDVEHEPTFPIDVVYTWVDDHDPRWQAAYDATLAACSRDGLHDEAYSAARFHNRDELRYSLRSLASNAPFVRNIFIVTAGQVPDWLDPDFPNVRVVPHEEILDADCLPTFNSHAIESALHRIHGLAEHYLYLNDDFFFGRECKASTFFTADGQPKLFPDQRAMVPDGPCSPADRAVDSASKNTREIMAAEFGYPVKYKMQHVPYPQRRSVLYEMEQRYPLAFKQTARNPFRHHTDLNIPSCFSHYYAFATGAAVTGRVPASYINIGNPWAQLTMRRLLQRADRDVFCLNDGPMGVKRRTLVDAAVRSFLEAYFPAPAPFELGG